MDKEKIISMLRHAGVPREAFHTTLAKEGLGEVREYITNKVYEQRPLVYIYPATTKSGAPQGNSMEKAELCLYLAVKELVLSGLLAYVCPLIDVHTGLFKDTEEAETLSDLIKSPAVGVARFYDRGGKVGQFMSQYEIEYFSSWLYRRYNNEEVTILLGSAPLSECSDWWPASLLAYIRNRAVTFEIKG